MKISKTAVLVLGGIFATLGLGLMVVNAAEKNLTMDLKNAVQHFKIVKLITEGDNTGVKFRRTDDWSLIEVDGVNNFIITTGGTVEAEINQIIGVDGSSILGGKGNKIQNGGGGYNYNVILGGEGNLLEGSDKNYYNVILGGKGNRMNNASRSVILGGEGNKVNGFYAVAVGNSNTVNGSNSIAVGKDNTVNGARSVALGSNGFVYGQKSFLWTNDSSSVSDPNVFVVNGASGMVINGNEAHSFAKLTIGGSLVIGNKDVANCEKGVVKVKDNTANGRKCFCSCNGSGRSSLHGGGSCASVCNGGSAKPECNNSNPTITLVNNVYNVENGCIKGNVIVGTGAFFIDKSNYIHWACETDNGVVDLTCNKKIGDGEMGTTTPPEATCNLTVKGGCFFPENATAGNTGSTAPEDKGDYYYWTCKYGANVKECIMNKNSCVELPLGGKLNDESKKPDVETICFYDPGSTEPCAYHCDASQNYVPNSTNNGCEKLTQHTCGAGENPQGAGVRTGAGIYLTGTYTPNKWTYASVNPSALKACQWTCDTDYERNGNGCKLKGKACGVGDNPHGKGVITGASVYLTGTYTPNKWTYASVNPSVLKACQWTCDTDYVRDGNTCRSIPKLTCNNNQKYKCSDGADGKKTGNNGVSEDGSMFVWECGDENCWMCNVDNDWVYDSNKGKCIKCLEGTRVGNSCTEDLNCPKGQQQVGTQCLTIGSCLINYGGTNTPIEGWDYNGYYKGGIAQAYKDVRPLGTDKMWKCKDSASQVHDNSCEFSCAAGYWCNTDSYHPEQDHIYCETYRCIRRNKTVVGEHEISGDDGDLAGREWDNPTQSTAEGNLVPFKHVSESELQRHIDNKDPGCFFHCIPPYVPTADERYGTCTLGKKCHRVYNIMNENGGSHGGVTYNHGAPNVDDKAWTYFSNRSQYQQAESRGDACIWTCQEGIPVEKVHTNSSFSQFSSRYNMALLGGDYNICYKQCPEKTYFDGVSCISPNTKNIVDKSKKFTYGGITNYTAQKEIFCEDGAYNPSLYMCIKNGSLAEECSKLGAGWVFDEKTGQCIKCAYDDENYNPNSGKCE